VCPTRKARTADLYDMYFRRHIRPELGTKRAREVRPNDVAKLRRKIGAKAPVTANRIVALISGLYSWAARTGRVPHDLRPARGITRYREERRERFLSSAELERLGDALREAETVGIPWTVDDSNPKAKHVPKKNRRTKVSPFATVALRLLLFTGCRLREILNLRWMEFDRDRGLLPLPDSKTGRKPVILSEAAIALLESLPRAGEFVIAGNHPEQARRDLKRPWEAIRQRAGLADMRLHDLRHYSGTRIIPATEPNGLLFQGIPHLWSHAWRNNQRAFQRPNVRHWQYDSSSSQGSFGSLRADARERSTFWRACGGERTERCAEPPIQRSRRATV
jgi:integrase